MRIEGKCTRYKESQMVQKEGGTEKRTKIDTHTPIGTPQPSACISSRSYLTSGESILFSMYPYLRSGESDAGVVTATVRGSCIPLVRDANTQSPLVFAKNNYITTQCTI